MHTEQQVKMKAEIMVVPQQTKESQRSPANPQKLGERRGTDSSSQPLEGATPANTLI